MPISRCGAALRYPGRRSRWHPPRQTRHVRGDLSPVLLTYALFMARRIRPLEELRLLGGCCCLDFTNTVEPREGTTAPYDYIRSYPDLIAWSRYAHVLDSQTAARLENRAASSPGPAEAAYSQAIALREAIYSAFTAIAAGSAPPPSSLLVIDRTHCETAHAAHLVWNGHRAAWRADREHPALDYPLTRIVWSVIDLLTGLPGHTVKQCPGANDCGWLFLDTSKNKSRQWCRSDGCGARVKMRRRYQRERGIGGSAPNTAASLQRSLGLL